MNGKGLKEKERERERVGESPFSSRVREETLGGGFE